MPLPPARVQLADADCPRHPQDALPPDMRRQRRRTLRVLVAIASLPAGASFARPALVRASGVRAD